MLNSLLNNVGLRWTLRIWAISTTLCSAVAMLGMRSRFPVPKFSADQRRPKLIPSRLDFLHTPLFWSFVSSYPSSARMACGLPKFFYMT